MRRFYQNLLGQREDKAKPMKKSEALAEARQWLRNLSGKEAGEAIAALRSERPATGAPLIAPRPFAHPFYWAGFVLIGDPW